MFTGLIEAVGEVAGVEPTGRRQCACASDGARRRAARGRQPRGERRVPDGDLASTAATSRRIGPETARVTTLGSLAGQPVNLERPLRADGRFGGHFVRATSTRRRRSSESRRRRRALADDPFPADARAVSDPEGIDRRGRHQPDGRAALATATFDVMIVPFTWEHTNLRALRPATA